MLGWLKKLLGGGGIPSLSPQEAHRLMQGGAVMLDVRHPDERQRQHIGGSLHVPLGDLSRQASTLPRDKVIICQCASGKRSQLAAAQLAAQGLDVRNLQGGLAGWQSAGLPVE